jgi:hypothetical protein
LLRQSEIGNLGRLQLKLELVCDKGDKLRIRGFSFGIADSIAEKSLQSVQIASVPCHFDGMADGTLHPAGEEGFCASRTGNLDICNMLFGQNAKMFQFLTVEREFVHRYGFAVGNF